MFLDRVEISRAEEVHLRKWLRRFYKAEEQLTNKQMFPEHVLIKLLKLESQDRQRKTVLARLMARYTKVRREREWQEINVLVGKEMKYARERH